MADKLLIVLKIIVPLGLFNVWILRFNKTTKFRGGGASNMIQEFAIYGLPPWSVYVVGVVKVTCGLGLLASFVLPSLAAPASMILAGLMVGAVLMHFKVKDSPRKFLPAVLMLIMILFILIGSI